MIDDYHSLISNYLRVLALSSLFDPFTIYLFFVFFYVSDMFMFVSYGHLVFANSYKISLLYI